MHLPTLPSPARVLGRAEDRNETVDVSDLEQSPDSLAQSGHGESPVLPLARSQDTQHGSKPGGIHVWDSRQIDDD